MIYLTLFLTFLKIGAVSFGGGYGMISLVREEVLSHGWLTDTEFINFIAVAESTPGPIAVNMATFIGSSQAGIWGSLLATLGVILPSFIIILLIAAVFKNLLKLLGVKWALDGVKPVVAGLIVGTGVTMFLSTVLGVTTVDGGFSFDYKALIILAVVVLTSALYKKFTKKKISPIILIVISALLGLLLYSI
ncbi:MAG: chromate transporter [Clostridia bacterium]|nr:chromate transporter [Clostridia bacterium]